MGPFERVTSVTQFPSRKFGKIVFSSYFCNENHFCIIMNNHLTIPQLSRFAQGFVPKGTSVWLYGSRARGTAHADSDWDVLILLDKSKIEQEDFERVSYPLIEYGWHFGADLSPQLYTRTEWERMRHTPYCQNVERDKKIIYESD